MPSSVRKSTFQYIKDAANNGAVGPAVPKSADFNSIGYSLGNADYFGIGVVWANGAGTSPTLDVTGEWSPDGGTTWYTSLPQEAKNGAGDEIQVHIDQIDLSSDGDVLQFFKNFSPLESAGGLNFKTRFKFNLGGTTPSADLSAYLITIDRG